MIRLYSRDLPLNKILSPEESGHCCRVLRMSEGDIVKVTDGKGSLYECRIVNANPKATEIEILHVEKEADKDKGKLTLAVAPTKNADRMEWLVEKAVEMGIDRIVLLKCEHSERKVMRLDRLHKIMISAMKQSLKTRLPELIGPVPLDEFLEESGRFVACKITGYCSSEYPRKDLVEVYRRGENLIVMIGPEGDFSFKEIERCVKAGFVPVSFGNTRLRTETAALYAVTAFHVINSLNN